MRKYSFSRVTTLNSIMLNFEIIADHLISFVTLLHDLKFDNLSPQILDRFSSIINLLFEKFSMILDNLTHHDSLVANHIIEQGEQI